MFFVFRYLSSYNNATSTGKLLQKIIPDEREIKALGEWDAAVP
jgi:hypothetical protein